MTTLTTPGTVTTRRSSRLMWAILALVLLADAVDVIDATITNIAAPAIAGELGGGESLIRWLGPAYMLAMGVLLVAGGRLGDKFGQRRLFLIGPAGHHQNPASERAHRIRARRPERPGSPGRTCPAWCRPRR
jgi:hypothetical protein